MFNPFGKDFEDVKQDDLEILRSTAEGWYVEYKREKPSGRKIAKSVSSFANSYGGIYFIGIEADTSRCARGFEGIMDSPDVIRDSVRGNVQPFPHFETHVINLGNGKRILMAFIPEGKNPPYIHSDGRVYRRQEGASDPIHENDRHSIDALYRKAEEFKEELEDFRSFDLEFTRGEEEIPYLEMFVNTVPFNHFMITDFFKEDNMRRLLNQFNDAFYVEQRHNSVVEHSFSGKLQFDTLNTYHDSVTMRYLEGQNLAYNGMTLMIDLFGNLKVLVPLVEKHYSADSVDNRPDRYLNVLRRSHSISSIGFLDARQIMGAIFGVMSNYVKYLAGKEYKGEFEVKMRLRNCWRKSIYIDSERFLAHIEDCGIPICMKSEQCFPFAPITLKIEKLETDSMIEYLLMFAHVTNALGVPHGVALVSVVEEMQKNPQAPGS